MSIKPVSFGTLMVFTIKDGKPKADVPSLITTSFKYNKALSGYTIKDTFQHEEEMDGTIHNATKNFARMLDRRYEGKMPKGSKQVILTEGTFTINPRETEKKYFLTASSWKEENLLLDVFNRGDTLYAVKFR